MDRQKTDIELIARCKVGDQKAFAELFDFYYKPVFYYIFSILKDYQDAEDQTMITIEKAFKNLDKYQPLYKFQTWLSKIARTTAIDFMRFKRTRLYSDIELSQVFYIKNIETPEQKIVNQENLTSLRIKINSLTEKRREIVILRIMGYRCREIAEETGVGINTIVGQISRIKQKLVS